jgi:ribosomal protein S18 acetylase RimI-like enzyme
MADVRVQVVDEVTPELVGAFERLVPQLSTSSPPTSHAHLVEIVESPSTVLFVARDFEQGELVVGSLTLVLFRIPTGQRAWIEDVVVDEASTRQGIGQALNEAAVAHAREWGARTVDLTSRPAREVANRLYARLGFEKRDTNVYRLTL